jgi:2-oxoglutarate dehydrogenase complex dehydrogenase (E1) component-like enzyme
MIISLFFRKEKMILKLNEAVSFEFLAHKIRRSKKLEGWRIRYTCATSLIESAAEQGVKQFVMGMALVFEFIGKYFWKIYTRHLW